MHPTIPFFLAALYVWIYYGVARSALRELREVDPDYYRFLGAEGGLGMKNAMAVGQLLFDRQIPKAFYPARMRRKIAWARGMACLSPLVIIVAIWVFFAAG